MMQENLLKEYGIYINGKWRPASDGATFSSTDPATGEHLAVCAEATKADVDDAVKAAQKAFEPVNASLAKPGCSRISLPDFDPLPVNLYLSVDFPLSE